jgi:hypothetical protein
LEGSGGALFGHGGAGWLKEPWRRSIFVAKTVKVNRLDRPDRQECLSYKNLRKPGNYLLGDIVYTSKTTRGVGG